MYSIVVRVGERSIDFFEQTKVLPVTVLRSRALVNVVQRLIKAVSGFTL